MFRLDHHKPGVRLEQARGLAQERHAIGHFMNHIERQHEIGFLAGQIDVIRSTLVQDYSVQNSFFSCQVTRYPQHFLLHIGCDNPTVFADHPGKRDREKTASATQINRGVPRAHITREYLPGVLNQPAQRTVKPSHNRWRAYMPQSLIGGFYFRFQLSIYGSISVELLNNVDGVTLYLFLLLVIVTPAPACAVPALRGNDS